MEAKHIVFTGTVSNHFERLRTSSASRGKRTFAETRVKGESKQILWTDQSSVFEDEQIVAAHGRDRRRNVEEEWFAATEGRVWRVVARAVHLRVVLKIYLAVRPPSAYKNEHTKQEIMT